MIKILEYPDFTNNLPNVRLVEADQIKIAASDEYHPEILNYIRDNNVPRGITRVIDLALTDFEGFGANNNGDGFWRDHLLKDNDYSKLPYFIQHPDEQAVMPMYKSWERFGRFYYHHLNKIPEVARGIVRKVVYNIPMNRVELIVDINNDKATDVIDMINNGGFPGTSMGFRCWPTGDVCSICRNFDSPFKNRSGYCDHLKHHMMEILPDGRLEYAINPNGYFFDISFVRRPADRTSYILSKVASDKYAGIFRGYSTDMADKLGYNESELDKFMDKTALKQATVKIIDGGVDAIQIPDEDVNSLTKSIPELLQATDRPIPNKVLDALARQYRIRHILATLEQMGVIMKPKEFQRIIVVKEMGQDAADWYDNNGYDIKDYLDRVSPVTHEEVIYSPSDFSPDIAERMQQCRILQDRSRLPRYLLKRADSLTDKIQEYYESYPIWPVKTPISNKMKIPDAQSKGIIPNIIINNLPPQQEEGAEQKIPITAGSKIWKSPILPLLGIASLFLGIKSIRKKSELARSLMQHKAYIYPFLAGIYLATAALQSPGEPEKKAATATQILSDPFTHAVASIIISYGLAGRAKNLREQGRRPNVMEQTYEKNPFIGSLINYVGLRGINTAIQGLMKRGEALNKVVTDVDIFNKVADENEVMALAFYKLSELSKIKNLNDLSKKTDEGKILIATLGRLSSAHGYSHRHPDDILRECVGVAQKIYPKKKKM